MYHLQSNLSNGNTEENNLYNNILFTRNIHRMAPIKVPPETSLTLRFADGSLPVKTEQPR